MRERKRHTARCVANTPYVVLTGYPGGTWSGTPPGGVRIPPRGYPVRYPPGGVPGQVPPGGYPVRYPPRGYPVRYPPGGPDTPLSVKLDTCAEQKTKARFFIGQTDGWKDRRLSKHYLPSYSVRGW